MRRRPLLLVIAVAALVLFISIFYARRSQNKDQGASPASRQSAPNNQGSQVGRFEPVGVLSDDDEIGQLRLEGQVIDATEAPVSRAVVTLSSNPPRVTTTEDDGSFFFDKVLERRYSVVARARSGVAGPLSELAPLRWTVKDACYAASRCFFS